MLLFVLSTFTVVAQEQEDVEVPDEIEDEAKNAPSIRQCVNRVDNYLKGKGKNVKPARIAAFCDNLRNNPDVKDLGDVNKRLKMGERLGQMQDLNNEQRQKLENLRPQVQAKLKKLDDTAVQKIGQLSDEQIGKLQKLGLAKLKQCTNGDDLDTCLNQYKIKTFVNKAEMFRQRTVENYKEARQKYQNAKDKHKEIKEDLTEYRQAFKDAVDSEDEKAAMSAAKEYLGKVADLVINSLEKIGAKIEENDDLSQEEVDEMLADIEAKIAQITEAKTQVEAAQTKEEIKVAGKTITQSWNKMKNQVELHASRVVRATVQDVIKRAEFLERKLYSGIEKLQNAEHDTTEVEDLLEDFASYIGSAKENFAAAKEAFNDARDTTEDGEAVKDLVHEGQEYLKQANEDMKEANKLSKEILKKIRESGADVESVLEESDEDYYEVEDEDESDDDDNDEEESDEDEEIECTTDTDCEAEEFCDNGECEDKDETDNDDDEESDDNEEDDTEKDACTTDAECDADKVCLDGECEESDDNDEDEMNENNNSTGNENSGENSE